jgi:hypothetical protein
MVDVLETACAYLPVDVDVGVPVVAAQRARQTAADGAKRVSQDHPSFATIVSSSLGNCQVAVKGVVLSGLGRDLLRAVDRAVLAADLRVVPDEWQAGALRGEAKQALWLCSRQHFGS